MTLTVGCHPAVSRLLALIARDIRAKRASSPVPLTCTHEARVLMLNRERPQFQRFAALRVAPGSTSQIDIAHAIDRGCCHRARRRQGYVRCAHRLRRP